MADEIITTGYKAVNMSWSNFTGFTNAVNDAGGGWTFASITFLIFFVLLVILSASFGFEAGILGAAFIAFIIGMLFAYAGIMSWWIASIFVGVIIVAIMYIMWKQN
jgi:hypothetical protein